MDKKFVLKLVREAVDTYAKTKKVIPIPKEYPSELNEKRGVFVTIHKIVSNCKQLRGCIGLPYPDKPLIEGLIEAAVSACDDSRFLPLKADELKHIRIEVSILTEPELIEVKSSKDYVKKIKIGRDGLILSKGIMSGLFLPQVPVEQKWDLDEYLENLCLKAGLMPDAWTNLSAKIYRFQAEIFEE
jgi:uncharacterized protein (TIGR00296 family)